ncbi:SDR family NAD(P)-dependent oxidoreductase [Steroidobacter agaridevorans]|uniref:SDR family NAD(P)-dependent oxidoreductase n=1 Tax=Steroidobacter agaridevorans TaxID=2695856 RepID=UPI00132334D6|nr:SDR family NAD(P)-dependent oxidoreductase [Steroidobacter agaridevorans]GFE86020.1 hypothetical protein GCM10011488_09740 [Steroidobacter agaridevorans]
MDDLHVVAAAAELSERGYIVRPAAESDLPRLIQLEELCWQHTRTSEQQLRARLQRYPEGQFVLEKSGQVLGVVYSQRIKDVAALSSRSAVDVHELHDASGSVVQLLALNVDPAVQNLSLGDQLLEFMLQRCSSIDRVDRVVGVTLCKRFDAAHGVSFDEYIHRRDNQQDPVLALHCSHGATVVGSIANYRPEDAANEHNGVLVSYDIHGRQARLSTDQTDAAFAFDQKEVERFVRAEVARVIGDEQGLDTARPLMEMGLSSADLLQLQLQMERRFGRTLRPGFFFEHNCVDKVVAYFSKGPATAPEKQASRPALKSSKDIAIVGMSCRLPGGVETPDDFWEVLAAAECVIGSYPKTRGNWPSATEYPGIDQGGYLSDGDAFDASFFRVSPAEAQITDPQQRILLELAWSCLEDAAVLPAHLRGTRTGVFVGASNCDYSRLIQTAGVETEAHHATGSSLAIIANRLSYFFDLSGPSMLIDTACSSSLVALHTAVQSLHAGECESALVGGVNFICHPDLSVAYHKAGMLARDGRCKVFDARANGYVRAEGGVMLLLKPLSEAIRAQDNIHAVIRGSAVNHGGLSGGLTVPDPKKQRELLIAAWNSAGISPRELSYIEAHGTGTSLGDPIEVQGIQTAYSSLAGISTDKTCAVGSLKSNLGHLESAAGIAGVLKVVLSMKYRQLPGQPTFDKLNPKITLDDSPFYVAERRQGWPSNQHRLAGVSSFGSGGANAHCVVQEYVAETQDIARAADDDHLFVISATDETRLRACARKIVDWLDTNELGERFGDAIYTWQAGRTAMKRRLAIKVGDAAELRAKLQQWLSESSCPADAWLDEVNSRDPGASRLWQEEEGLQLVARALAERNLGQLGAFWTSGADVDWQKLYSAEPRRVSVPTYSFARESHWIDLPEIETNEHAVASGRLLVAPVWEAASLHDDARGAGFSEHRILLCELPEIDAEKIRTLTQSNHCLHLRCHSESLENRYVDHALACFEEVKRILTEKPRGRVLLQVVVPQQQGALLAGLSGLLSTATRENPNLIGQMILTEAGINYDALAAQLRREKDSSSATLIRYSQGQRHILRWQEVGPTDPSLLAFKHDGVYLITGGLGGLGRVFAKEILRHAPQARVVLTGRSALTEKRRRPLDELARLAAESGGRAPEYRQLDLTDLTHTRSVIEAVANEHRRIDGIIHCAGMISDSFILKKTAEEFKRVLEPKVVGTSNLDATSKDLQLDFLVLFSSFSSAVGNVGQADYAAANGFMDQFAAYRNRLVDAGQRHGHTLSIHWPLWQEGGMAMDAESAETLRQAMGMEPMQTATGVRAFHDSLLSRKARTMVLEGDVEKLKQTLARANKIQPASTPITTSVAPSSNLLREATLKKIKQLFAEVLKLPAAKVDTDEPFSSYGIDSILINQMNRKLAEVFGDISKTLFFEYKTLAELTAHLVQTHEAGCVAWTGSTAVGTVTPSRRSATVKQQLPPTSTCRREPIAIIGISGIYPQAPTLEEFWKNLESGRNCVSEIPPERWSLDGFYVPDVEQAIAQGKSYSKWGGFIEQFAQFEPLFFNISPREALNMDPQERLFLQEAWRAMENAGYTRNDLKHRFQRKVGVFAGITKTGFELYATPAASIDDGFFPRTSFSSVANRVSYFLDITGPSLPIDTMCSSSLTAIHEACEHINRGDCELAFAGGVNLYLHPATYTWLSSQQMLSRDGLCRSFGAGGNGYVPGEGVGVVMLKSLSSALRDNDNIHGIILATHVNHGGRANGYTVPSPRAQAELVSRTIEKAGIKADDVSYIEAHGTGTELGDPIEISGLQQTFAGTTRPCSIGSAKSNIGHLESAAGIAGLTKVLLQMKHQSIAPSLHAAQLNPNIDFDKSAFRVNRSLSPWQVRGEDGRAAPRIAGISSFGAGGSNAHIIVQEFQAPATSSNTHEPHAVLLSAGTSEQLRQRARDLLAFVQAERGAFDLRSVAYTLQVGREAMEARLGMLVSSVDQLVDKLQAFLAGEQDIEDVYQGQAKSNKETLRLFGGDEDFQATLDRWLARRKFSKLLELWSKGLDVEWDKLYESDRPRRIALPTYPFNKERYWIDAVEGVRAWDAPSASSVAAAVHPLLHANTSNLDRQSYTSTFTGEEFFLRDHQVRGNKVLPAVAYLEMARAAVELASPKQAPGRILELQHTAWLQPIAVSSSKEVTIALSLNESDPTGIDFEVQSADAEAIHCQGQARWVDGQAVPGIDIQRLKAEMSLGPLDVEALYARFTQSGISYGPAHRAITGIHLGEGQLLAQLTLPGVVASTSQSYVLHPSLMDSALQGCLALIGESEGGPLLPFELDTLRVVAPCTAEMFAWVRRSDPLKFDVDLCDRFGNVCVQMSGFASRALDSGSTADKGQLYSLAPIWSRLRTQQAGESLYSPESILLLGEQEAPLAWLQKSYPQAEFVQLSANASIETIQALLEPHATERLVWVAPDVLGADGEDDIVAGQEQGVLTVFRIAKALVNLNRAERSLHWTLITRHTQNVRKNDRVSPTHGALSGLVGSLAKEYPEWNLQLLDVDDLQSLGAEQCLTLPANKQGDCLAHRQGEWFVEGLARVDALPESPAAYRQGGVYVVIGGAGGIGEVWSRFMVEHYQAELVWIGRRPLDTAIEDKLQSLAQLGPAPRYFSADATRLDSLQATFDRIREIYPRIHGVVHSAIVLQDQSLSRMDEATFRSSLAAKVDVSVNMDAVFGGLDLDFMLFFSSLISFTKAPGQSNYAAGCTFKDSFAHSLARRRSYPIKIMNWGFWGNVGIVAAEFYNRRMQQMGFGSIEAPEAMDALKTLVSAGVNQLALVKAIDVRAVEGISRPEVISYASTHVTDVLPSLREQISAGEPPAALKESVLAQDVMDLAERILAANLESFQNEQMPDPLLGRWLDASVEYLRCRGRTSLANIDELWSSWAANEAAWQENPNTRPHLALLKACLQALPEILSGTRKAADVMFPESSLRLVSGVYAGNAVSDYYNTVLAQTLCACIRQRRQADPSSKIRILEIGAGTGGTTKAVLPLLRELDGGIEEYCYTDLSKAFLIHAEEHYRPGFPALRTALFDASKPISSQAVTANHYDFVIATNVLHATADIRETMRNAKGLLKKHGIILLNEMSEWSLFNHLTFGLLDGWWLYEDVALRISGSPALAPETWGTVLEEEGFGSVAFPAGQARAFGQQIIVASSDGQVRQRVAEQPRVNTEATSERMALAKHATPATRSDGTAVEKLGTPATASAAAGRSLRDKAVAYLQGVVAKALRMEPSKLEPGRPLAEYGLDSIVVVGVTSQLRRAFTGVTSTLFFELRSIDCFADFILENKKEELIALVGGDEAATPEAKVSVETRNASRLSRRVRPQASTVATPKPAATATVFDVAIIGVAGRYPQSANLGEFWNNLANGRNCVTEVPKDRWDWQEFFDAERGKAGKIYTKWGGFLDRIDGFDPLFFKIAPKEAKAMDPQERLFLESCYHAIEDAGYTPASLGDIDKVGVFVGVMNSRYTPQPLHYSIANRVSFVMNFQGPSLAVDTACSASLTAIHLALESIYSGSSECAIAGGVNLIIDPVHYLELSALTMLSAGQQCKSFGNEADGFVDAEGVGAIVLKPLSKAERDGDHIYGVIKGSALNAGGKTNGYTVPNPQAQSAVISKALRRANIAASDISYVEAHGTGTALGDPIEIAGLTRAFEQSTRDKQFCAIGSLKSNIGHCESAAGIAGLTKVLLQLEHKQLVPSLHADVPNPEIEFDRTPFRVQLALEEWQRPRREVDGVSKEIARTAGVSSFGAGGANAHIIVQEHEYATAVSPATEAVIVPLSARTTDQLRGKACDLLDLLRSPSRSIDLLATAYTLQVGREPMEERVAFVVASIDELATRLASFVAGDTGDGTHRGRFKRTQGRAPTGVDEAVAARDLPRLAHLWTQGADIEWIKLYGDAKPRRISLPLYPFAKDRYWRERTEAPTKPAVETKLHPLLHRNVSDVRHLGYSATFRGSEDFLTDHPVAPPPAVYLEMARAAIQIATASPSTTGLELFNVVWADAAAVLANQPINVALFARDDEQLDYEIYSQQEEGDTVHLQGQSVLSAEAAPTPLDLAHLQARMLKGKRSSSSFYSSLAETGIHYGPAYQAVTEISLGDRELLAEISVPKPTAELVLHPVVMDGALQAAFDLIPGEQRPSQPLALESLRILGACGERMFAWVRYSQGEYAEPMNIQLDIDLCDPQGNVSAQMRGVTYEPARDVSGNTRSIDSADVEGTWT